MVTVFFWMAMLAVGLSAPALSLRAEGPQDPALAARLEPHLLDAGLSCLLVDTATGEILFSRWDNLDEPIPPGSLLKPFAALAYAAAHQYRYPEFECEGLRSGCWLPPGHGKVGMRAAIAHSCNAYFRRLSQRLHPTDLRSVAARFSLPPPSRGADSTAYFGLGSDWALEPLQIARAYGELARRRAEPGVPELLHGMIDAAQTGTAAAIGRLLPGARLFAKTGTAPCAHSGIGTIAPGFDEPSSAPLAVSNGDGYALVVYPAEGPQFTLLVRVHGVPGRLAASHAGRLLQALVKGE